MTEKLANAIALMEMGKIRGVRNGTKGAPARFSSHDIHARAHYVGKGRCLRSCAAPERVGGPLLKNALTVRSRERPSRRATHTTENAMSEAPKLPTGPDHT